MKNCMKHLISELFDAINYCELAMTEEGKCKTTYRDLALSEIDHVEKLIEIYKAKSGSNDAWLEVFKDEADSLKTKLRQL